MSLHQEELPSASDELTHHWNAGILWTRASIRPRDWSESTRISADDVAAAVANVAVAAVANGAAARCAVAAALIAERRHRVWGMATPESRMKRKGVPCRRWWWGRWEAPRFQAPITLPRRSMGKYRDAYRSYPRTYVQRRGEERS